MGWAKRGVDRVADSDRRRGEDRGVGLEACGGWNAGWNDDRQCRTGTIAVFVIADLVVVAAGMAGMIIGGQLVARGRGFLAVFRDVALSAFGRV